MKTKIVVIGNGMVGYKFCEKLVTKDVERKFDITVLGEEYFPAYDRVHLSEFFNGKTANDLSMAPQEWYSNNGIKLYLGELVSDVNIENKTVFTHKGHSFTYDKLIFATGSAPFVPPIKGINNKGVFVYRTIEDLEAITAYAKNAKRGAVIGGGLLGLEAAKALLDLNLETEVIEFAPRLMPRQLDEAGSDTLRKKIEELNLKVNLKANTSYIGGEEKIEKLVFDDDKEIAVDMVVVSAGIKPRDELAKNIGLKTGVRGGIIVDDTMKTSTEDIYAIGEVALHNGMIYGLVAPGYEMAEVVATNLLGGDKTFTGFDMSTKLKLIGVEVASFGDPFGDTEKCNSIVFEDKTKGIYKRINVSADGKRLIGGVLVGDAESYNMLLQITKNALAIPANAEDLILGARGGAADSGAGVMQLPDEAIVCSCEGVTKGAICSAIKEKELDGVAAIKSCTKAGTGCGGCVPMVSDLFNATMKAEGKSVRNVICEHFNYTRQELYDFIKIEKVKTYSDLLKKHGQGYGCEICKPAVASMMASVWNEPILKQDTIQDTNDRYLANIQKGGTYSIVPRVPGGEITADKLIALGAVAKKYDLYCKITGGQRIDLFGARVDQLPVIWEELIAYGFESGHAYGKALRTVKSCVGSSWCRFGVQDSVTFAIEVEERYKGFRAPHKLKSAVSGCIRECAEARSKDFGIIATEKGWNLYICGNGGAKPRHAELFAADIDKETCIKYIDRFLLFYTQTANPLTRTSTWLDNLEGGIEHVKDVVINDVLGKCAEWEEQMKHIVNTYKCEWKDVVEDEEKRKRFKPFINTEEPDVTIKFEKVREQINPLTSW
jgi:nitrite reductase (NADH) large subunit